MALKIAQAKFPGKHVNLFGPSDAGGNLTDFYRSFSGESIDERFHIDAGWNMTTGTLKLPIPGKDFAYQDVDKPKKGDSALVTIVSGAPDPANPQNIFVFVSGPGADLPPFWLKPLDAQAKGIVAVVTDEVPK